MSQSDDDLNTGLVVAGVLYPFDIMLDSNVVPSSHDEEVKEFGLYTVDEVKQALSHRKYKPNRALVMIDFFVRHGILSVADHVDCVEINGGMHRKLPISTSPSG